MARIVITSGPTRQFLDPVRYLTNASSGRMGAALAAAALALNHEVTVISGPVQAEYPTGAEVVYVVSTEEMLEAAQTAFDGAAGLIGAAAPCDYRPRYISDSKIAKTSEPLQIELLETEDIVATLANTKGKRWVVGFALETSDHRLKALAKLQKKRCDLMVSNGTSAINSTDNSIEILAPSGDVVATFAGPKLEVARVILQAVERFLMV